MAAAARKSGVSTLSTLKSFYNVIDGQSREASTGDWIESLDPARGTSWARVPRGDQRDVAAAVEAAQRAFEGPWRRMAASERARLLRKLAEGLEARVSEFVDYEVLDNGRTAKETRFGWMPFAAETLYFYAGLADKIHGDTIQISPKSFNYTLREPMGVIGLIIPYNAPLTVLTTKMGAALAAGNTVVIKPSEYAASTTLLFAELARDVGFPDGVINVVSGYGAEAGAALVEHPLVRKIGFTGSVASAQAISRAAAQTLKPLQFELGGKSPHVICADADLDVAIPQAVRGIMTGAAGQSCVAGSRILIERSIWKETVDAVLKEVESLKLGDPLHDDTDMGPLTFAAQFDKVSRYVETGLAEGTEILCGGSHARDTFPDGSEFRGGFWYKPTFFTSEDNAPTVVREEIFGPVGALIPFDTDEHAIRLANESDLGLAAGIWTTNIQRGLKFVNEVQAGTVWVNSFRRTHWAVPFGGFKNSGYGKDFGVEAMYEYQQIKTAWVEL